MKKQIEQIETSLALLASFDAKYGQLMTTKTGEELLCVTGLSGRAGISISQQHLALVGEVFGREGWTRKVSYFGKNYHWTRTIDEVHIRIDDAEEIPVANDSPVPAKAFPLQITEA